MRKLTMMFAACAALLLSGVAHAQSVYSDTYVIPIAGHIQGALGNFYETDLSITNFNNDPLTVQILVIEQGEGRTDNVSPLVTDSINGSVMVPARGTVILRDVLANYHGQANTAGALILGGDKPFAATARLYSLKNGGVGDTIMAVSNFFENSVGRSDKNAIAYVTGITNNAAFRTNLGFVAATGSSFGEPLVVEVRVRDASGNSLGTRIVTTQSGQFTQTQFPVSSITTTPFDAGSAEFRVIGGSGIVVPYAAVNDNATGSAAFIMGQFPQNASISSMRSNLFRDLFTRITQ